MRTKRASVALYDHDEKIKLPGNRYFLNIKSPLSQLPLEQFLIDL